MILRTFSEADRDAVISLWHEVELTRPWNDPGKDIDRAAATWPELFVLAERDHAVVGTAMAGYDGQSWARVPEMTQYAVIQSKGIAI